jgi:hypothetical protein
MEPDKAQQSDIGRAAQNAFFANNTLVSKASAPSVEFFNASFLRPAARLLGADGGLGYLFFAMVQPMGVITVPGYACRTISNLEDGVTAVLTGKS